MGKYTDGWAGRIIDLLAVFALLAGTATTFSVATPLMATIIGELFHVAISRTVINIIILLITCVVYTYSLLHGSPVLSISLPDLLSWDNYKLDELFRRSQKNELNTILFSMEVSGVLRTCSFLCKKVFSIMKKAHRK